MFGDIRGAPLEQKREIISGIARLCEETSDEDLSMRCRVNKAALNVLRDLELETGDEERLQLITVCEQQYSIDRERLIQAFIERAENECGIVVYPANFEGDTFSLQLDDHYALFDDETLENYLNALFELSFLEEIDLSRCSLPSIPPSVGKLVNLRKLVLSHNALTRLPQEIQECEKLEHLDLRGNPIDESLEAIPALPVSCDVYTDEISPSSKEEDLIEQRIDAFLKDMEELGVDPSLIFCFEERTFFCTSGMPGYFSIKDLDDEKKVAFLKALFELDFLDQVHLCDLDLPSIPENVNQLQALSHLSIIGNPRLKEVPPRLGELPQLEEVELLRNEIEEIPSSLSEVKVSLFPTWSEAQQMHLFIREVKRLGISDVSMNNFRGKSFVYQHGMGVDGETRLSKLSVDQQRIFFQLLAQLTFLEEVNLSGNSLQEFPSELYQLEKLRRLDLSGNPLVKHCSAELARSSNLEVLNLCGTGIQEVPEHVLQIRNLQELDLSGNGLVEVPDSVKGIPRVKIDATPEERKRLFILRMSALGVSGLSLTSFEENGFVYDPSTMQVPEEVKLQFLEALFEMDFLEKVSLQRLGVSEIPSSIGKMTQLTSLDLSGNPLSDLPIELGGLLELDELNLADCRFESVPQAVLNLNQLSAIALDDNQLQRFPEELSILRNLRVLVLNGNPVGTVPGSISDFSSLEVLYLNNMGLKTLPASIGRLEGLTQLRLSGNELSELPEDFERLHRLQDLSLGGNQFSEVPASVCKLSNLQSLNLDANAIVKVPPEFSGLTSLQWLDLSLNRLQELPEEILDLKNLRSLGLIGNQISVIPERIADLTDLQLLVLNSNPIESLPESIGRLEHLTHFQMGHCRLSALPSSLGRLKELQDMNFAYNRIRGVPESFRELASTEPQVLDLSGNPIYGYEEGEGELGVEELYYLFEGSLHLETPVEDLVEVTRDEVDVAMDQEPLRVNREVLQRLMPPEIPDQGVNCAEMLILFDQIFQELNLTDPTHAAYFSREMVDIVENEDHPVDLEALEAMDNQEFIWSYLVPRLSGYVRTLYQEPLEEGDVRPLMMLHDAHFPEGRKALAYILQQMASADPEMKALRMTQLVNGLLYCHTGQTEALNALAYSAMGVEQTADVRAVIQREIASRKNQAFSQAILQYGWAIPHNPHLISVYRSALADTLGLSQAVGGYVDTIGHAGLDPFQGNVDGAYCLYYRHVHPQAISAWIQEKCQSAEDLELDRDLARVQKIRNKMTQTSGDYSGRIQEAREELVSCTDVQRKMRLQLTIRSLEKAQAQQQVSASEREEFRTLCEKYDATPDSIVQKLRKQSKENHEARPITAGDVTSYLISEKLVPEAGGDWWKAYFTEDPLVEPDAVMTKEGVTRLLVQMGILIDEREA